MNLALAAADLRALGAAGRMSFRTLRRYPANFIGQSKWTYLVVGGWGAILCGALVFWVIRPLLIHPKPAEVARMVIDEDHGAGRARLTRVASRIATLSEPPIATAAE